MDKLLTGKTTVVNHTLAKLPNDHHHSIYEGRASMDISLLLHKPQNTQVSRPTIADVIFTMIRMIGNVTFAAESRITDMCSWPI